MTKKKLLIDLMLENNVRWPDGSEFAAQDKVENKVWFYVEKPRRKEDKNNWRGTVVGKAQRLASLCRNWHQTIVTREQYEKAQEIRDDAGRNSEDAKPSKCIGEFHIDVKLSDIIDQISHHQAESQRHEEVMIYHNDKELALRDQLNEMLAKVGMKAVDIDTEQQEESNGWPDYCDENGIVTDWGKAPEGSHVECVVNDGAYNFKIGSRYNTGTDDYGDYGPVDGDGRVPSAGLDVRYKFRLIK